MTTRRQALTALLLTTAWLTTACNDPDTFEIAEQPIRVGATLSGAQQKPTSTTSTATGTFVGHVFRNTKVMSYTLTFAGITPTMAHIHRIEAADGTGPIIIPFARLTSPISGTATLTRVRMDSILNGKTYVNLHTARFPAGEIRGDIRRQ